MFPARGVNNRGAGTAIPRSSSASPLSSPAGSSGQAPAGDADWPSIKSQLAGSP
jgi:hypothetical protein